MDFLMMLLACFGFMAAEDEAEEDRRSAAVDYEDDGWEDDYDWFEEDYLPEE